MLWKKNPLRLLFAVGFFSLLFGCSGGGISVGSTPTPTPTPSPEPTPVPAPEPTPTPEPVGEQVFLSWLPHTDPTVTAYRVYYGSKIVDVKALKDVPASQTAVSFNSKDDLAASAGSQVCFRLSAVNPDGESPKTDGVCVTLGQDPNVVVTEQKCRLFPGTGPDKILTSLTASTPRRSYAFWVRQDGIGGGSFGRMIDKRSPNGNQSEEILHSSNGQSWMFVRGWSSIGFAQWQTPRPLDGKVHHFVVVYDSTSAENDPVMYIDGVSKPVEEIVAPAAGGTAIISSMPYIIGNRVDNARTWNGMICGVALWDSLLTPSQVADLAKGKSPLDVSPGTLSAYWPMHNGDNPEKDVIGGADGVVTGTTLTVRTLPIPTYVPPQTSCAETGLAAVDLAGNCRSSPTTMGALEVRQ